MVQSINCYLDTLNSDADKNFKDKREINMKSKILTLMN